MGDEMRVHKGGSLLWNKVTELGGLHNLLSDTSIAVLVCDSMNNILDANSAFFSFSEFDRDILIGLKLSDLHLSNYEGGLIFGDATTERLNDDQKIVQLVTAKNKKRFAIVTEHSSELNGEIRREILFQDVTPLIQDIEYYEFTSHATKVGGWEFDVINKTFRASQEVYDIHEVGLHSFFEISHPFKFYGNSVQEWMSEEFRDCIINQEPKYFDKLPFYSATGTKKWVKLTFTPVVAGDITIKIFGSLQDITREVELTQELENSKKRYQNLFNYSPNPLLVITLADHKIMQANQAALDFYGYSEDEILQLTAYDIRPDSHTEEYLSANDIEIQEYGGIQTFRKVTHQHKTGKHLLVDVYRRGANLDGEAVKIVLVNDVRAKYEVEMKLSQMNELLSKLIDSSPLAIITTDTYANVEMWNSSAEKMFGWKRSEVLGKELPYVSTEKRKEFEKNFEYGFSSGKTVVFEIERDTKDGRTLAIREYMTPLRNSEGVIDRFMLIIQDITEARSVKRALQESERSYRNLVEASNDLIWKLSKDSSIEFINGAATEILGYHPRELKNRLFDELLCDDNLVECQILHEKVIGGMKFENLDLKLLNRDGEVKHLNATVYPSFNANGEIIGCTGNASDITHIIEYQHHLESMLKEKEILIKEIHHRVKNNLAVVSGLLSLQANTQNDINTIQVLTESQSRIQSIATIHEKLYQNELFTQIEMSGYLKQLVSDIHDTYSAKNKEINVEVVGDEIYLNVNQAVPFGILANELMINAYKYAFSNLDSGLITLNIKKIEDEKVFFSVCDNGVGLPEGFTMENRSSLGMTLIQSLSYQLDAKLSYRSENGTCFSISFVPDK